MEMNDYQRGALKTAIYPVPTVLGKDVGFVYPALGLAGEAGEVAEKCKKILRDKKGYYTREDKVLMAKELGDVLWYVSAVASEFDLTLELIATLNLDKLASREQRGVLGGSGDNR